MRAHIPPPIKHKENRYFRCFIYLSCSQNNKGLLYVYSTHWHSNGFPTSTVEHIYSFANLLPEGIVFNYICVYIKCVRNTHNMNGNGYKTRANTDSSLAMCHAIDQTCVFYAYMAALTR